MASYLGFPFDPELFNYNWANAKVEIKEENICW